MLFSSEDHYKFYKEQIALCKNDDAYHRALIYTLGICPYTRSRFYRFYSHGDLNLDLLHEGWQTGTSLKVTRLAFNLYTDGEPTSFPKKGTITEENLGECGLYSPSDLFDCEYAPFFVQAIKIRYPEHFGKDFLTGREKGIKKDM